MKLRNLLRTPLSFNLSDGTPIHLGAREEMSLPEATATDAQVIRRLKRGLVRILQEPKAPEPIRKAEAPKEETGKTRGRSQRTTTRNREEQDE